jgi:general secretion pathway protein H
MGFTLIEMLVVLAILAVTATFAAPLLSSGSEGARLEMASSELATALRVTRSAAITNNSQTTLMIDVDRRRFGSTVFPERSFAPNIEAKLTFAKGIRSATSEGGFRFFPDGSSTGGEVTLSLRGKQAKLCVDWLTGTVRRAPSC